MATKATKDLKRYLLSWGSSGLSQEKVIAKAQQILQECNREEKHLVHVQLFLHLPYSELKKVHDEPGDFVFLVPSIGFPGIPPKQYCQLIVSGELVHHFMQMVLVLHSQEYIQELLTEVVTLLLDDKKYRGLYGYILFMLAKICRVHEAEVTEDEASESGINEFFNITFSNFLENFVQMEDIRRSEKLTMIMRLVGVSCMQISDYKGVGSDLVELVEEWSYDLSNRVAQKSCQYFKELFKLNTKEESLWSVPAKKVLQLSSEALKKLDFTDKEHHELLDLKTSNMTYLEFIGVHAFLTHSILEKYSSEINPELLNNLNGRITKWALHKPKLTREDFQGEIGDFYHFVQVIKRFGDKERDKQVLLTKFLEFSYDEVFKTKDGLKIADKYLVPGADYRIAVEYIKKAINFDSNTDESIPEKIKVVVLKLLQSNKEVKKRKEDLVSEIFSDGSGSHFALVNFAMDVNQVCSQIGFFEKKTKDVQQIEHNEDTVFHICFQNPVEAVSCLMKHSFRSQHYKVLKIAKPFLNIRSGPISKKSPSVMNFCFQKLVESTEDVNQFFECLIKAVPQMISNELITAVDVFEILQKSITEIMTSNVLLLAKASNLISMIDSMVSSGSSTMDGVLVKEIDNFTQRMIIFSYQFTNHKTGKDMLEIRRKCMKIEKQFLTDGSIIPPNLSENMEEVNKLNEVTFYELGLIYIRVPAMREHVKAFLKNPVNHSQIKYGQLHNYVVNWVMNSEPELEWPIVIEFFSQILLTFHDKLRNINPVQLLNESLYTANQSSVVKESPVIIRQYLKFYKNYIRYFWERDSVSNDDQVEIIETFVMLSMTFFETMKKSKTTKERVTDDTSVQQVLLAMLEILTWIVAKNSDFENTLKDKLLDAVVIIPHFKGKCEPIRKCIIYRILNHGTVRMMPLPDKVEISRHQKLNLADVDYAIDDPVQEDRKT